MIFPEYVKQILARLHEEGFAAYAVGGCVRDSLLGLAPHDWDITTSAHPEDVQRVFSRPPFATRVDNGLRHGTVTVIRNGVPAESCEVTTFRTEGAYSDHRRPDRVAFVQDPEMDLARRDFTVNAMAAAPVRRADGTEKLLFLDPFDGAGDLQSGVLRCVGDPMRRFEEDALRILRGIRFAARYGFAVDEATERAMHDCAHLLDCIAPERIGAELRGILAGEHCADVLPMFPDILDRILPGACPTGNFDVRQLRNSVVRIALLCLGCEEEVLRDSLLRMAIGKEETDRVILLLRHKETPLSSHRDLCLAADAFGPEHIEDLLVFRRCIKQDGFPVEIMQERFDEIFTPGVCYNVATLAVSGRDLMEDGIAAPGPEIGLLLTKLRDRVIDGVIPNEKAALLRAARSML